MLLRKRRKRRAVDATAGQVVANRLVLGHSFVALRVGWAPTLSGSYPEVVCPTCRTGYSGGT